MSHGRPPALVTTWCKVEKWEADFGEMCDAQTCVRAPATIFSPLFSLVSDNCHGHRATRLVKAIPCYVQGRAGVRPNFLRDLAATCRTMSPLVEFTTRALGQKY